MGTGGLQTAESRPTLTRFGAQGRKSTRRRVWERGVEVREGVCFRGAFLSRKVPMNTCNENPSRPMADSHFSGAHSLHMQWLIQRWPCVPATYT